MRRIVCVGNRYVPSDDAGPRTHDLLARIELPSGVELVDGGLAGLDLLRLADGAERLVFVDTLEGYCLPGEVVTLKGEDLPPTPGYGHADALAYLVRAIAAVGGDRGPEVVVVGTKGPADERAVHDLACASLAAAEG